VASLKSLQADKAGVVAWKRRLACADIDCNSSRTLRHPCCPIYPRHPCLPKGAKGPGNDAQPVCLSTDDPTALVGAREAGHRATRLATILGTAGGQWPARSGHRSRERDL
jgi:hypothetical protein